MKIKNKTSRKLVLATICLLLPRVICARILNALGWAVSPSARIGLSVVWVDSLCMAEDATIGGFNVFLARRLVMRRASIIKKLNVIKGPLTVWLEEGALVGRRNVIGRAPAGISFGPAQLRLGKSAIITAGHKIDCAASVSFGDYAILAGTGSQLWTHGYVHADSGPDRYRVDGTISIGPNVYVGSRVNILGGVSIGRGIILGVGVTVARSLVEPGMYVAAPLRRLPKPIDPTLRDGMRRVESPELVETVFRKFDDPS